MTDPFATPEKLDRTEKIAVGITRFSFALLALVVAAFAAAIWTGDSRWTWTAVLTWSVSVVLFAYSALVHNYVDKRRKLIKDADPKPTVFDQPRHGGAAR